MYAVFQSDPKKGSNLSDAHQVVLIREEKITFAEEALELTSDNVNKILFDNIRKLKDWIHSQKPNKLHHRNNYQWQKY